jgi:hypothetical protein
MCCSEIPEAARKCSHCHHFQNRAALILFHPVTAVLMVSLPMLVALVVFANMFERGESFQVYSNQILVTNTSVAFGETKNGHTVAVLGEIQNASAISWKDVNFHAVFKDASGRTIDVVSEDKFFFHLPPHSTSQFKLSFRREFPETNYVQHAVRVLSAKDAGARW